MAQIKVNIKRAIGAGALLWVMIFFEVSVLMFGFGMQNASKSFIHFILLAILGIIASLFYYKNAKGGVVNSFLASLLFLAVGIILDSIITVPLFMKMDYSFLITPYLLIGYLELVVIVIITGALKK